MSIVEPDPADVASWGYAVSVLAGQSVVWSNADAQPHTATAPDFAWDTGSLNAGEASALPFDSPGLFVYTCLPHPWMKGFLEVRPSD
jgi:plastocyanin